MPAQNKKSTNKKGTQRSSQKNQKRKRKGTRGQKSAANSNKSSRKKKRGPKSKKNTSKKVSSSKKKALKNNKKNNKKAAKRQARERVAQTSSSSSKAKQGSGGIVWAVFVIFVGVILLLNSTGVLPWSVWNILWRFWPILLILAGVQIIFGRIRLANTVNGILAIVLFALIFITILGASNRELLQRWNINLPDWWINISNNLTQDTGAEITEALIVRGEDYLDITKRDVTIDLGVGQFTLGSDEIENYLELQANYYEDYGKPILTQEQKDDTLIINFQQEHDLSFFSIPPEGLDYNFLLGRPALDTDLNIDIGAGKGVLELNNLTLGKVETYIGAGRVEMEIGENLTVSDELVINIGAGQSVVNLPGDVGFLLVYDVGAGSVEINDNTVGAVGDSDQVYKSALYDEAEEKITINVEVGAGQFSLRTINPE